MISGGEKESGLAQDTIFFEIMIILGGMIGISTLIGGKSMVYCLRVNKFNDDRLRQE